jgi:hypothetical protein
LSTWPFYIGEKPGSAQTMKLANNLLAATVLVATSEVVVMGVKAGLEVSDAIGRVWEMVARDLGPDVDFTAAIKPIERAAGVVVAAGPGD